MDKEKNSIERQKYQMTQKGFEGVIKAIEKIKMENHVMVDNKELTEILKLLVEESKKPVEVKLTLE
jgi:hypothetical protein